MAVAESIGVIEIQVVVINGLISFQVEQDDLIILGADDREAIHAAFFELLFLINEQAIDFPDKGFIKDLEAGTSVETINFD